MKSQGKKITIFLNAGLPRGVREVKIDQWVGKAICGPRNALGEILKLPDISQAPCIYFLTSNSGDGGLMDVYVGEADGFKDRIKNHDYSKDWWQEVIVFISQDYSLTKTGIQYLESISVERLKKAGRCNLKNANIPTVPTISKEDISGLEVFYENMTITMPLLGYDIFISSEIIELVEKSQNNPIFICKKGGTTFATAYLLDDGKMRVIKGSLACIEETDSFQTHPYKKLRSELISMKRLLKQNDSFIFSDDYVFDSSSAACSIVLGRAASGPLEWRTEEGISLKEFLNSKINI